MTYQWREGLEDFGGSLSYSRESVDLNDRLIRKQWSNIENFVWSSINKRNFYGGSYRSLENLKYQMFIERKLGYIGRPRKYAFALDEKNIPSHNPETDNGTIASGSTTTGPGIQQMETFVSCGVKAFLITYTTPEMLEEQRKKEQKKSAWDHFVKQEEFEKQVIYLPQRDPDKRKDSLFAPLNTEFENCLGLFSIAKGDCKKDYHHLYENTRTIPLKTISDTIIDFKSYFTQVLIPLCHVSQDRIYRLVKAIEYTHENFYDIGIVAPDINSIAGDCMMMRLTNCKFNGEDRSVYMITSENYGREGSSLIKSDTLVMGYSVDGKDVFTRIIMEEAKKKKVKQRFLIGNPDSDIAKYATEVVPVPWTVPGYNGVLGGFGPLGAQIIDDAIIAQVGKDLGYTEEDLRKEHPQHG